MHILLPMAGIYSFISENIVSWKLYQAKRDLTTSHCGLHYVWGIKKAWAAANKKKVTGQYLDDS